MSVAETKGGDWRSSRRRWPQREERRAEVGGKHRDAAITQKQTRVSGLCRNVSLLLLPSAPGVLCLFLFLKFCVLIIVKLSILMLSQGWRHI